MTISKVRLATGATVDHDGLMVRFRVRFHVLAELHRLDPDFVSEVLTASEDEVEGLLKKRGLSDSWMTRIAWDTRRFGIQEGPCPWFLPLEALEALPVWSENHQIFPLDLQVIGLWNPAAHTRAAFEAAMRHQFEVMLARHLDAVERSNAYGPKPIQAQIERNHITWFVRVRCLQGTVSGLVRELGVPRRTIQSGLATVRALLSDPPLRENAAE